MVRIRDFTLTVITVIDLFIYFNVTYILYLF